MTYQSVLLAIFLQGLTACGGFSPPEQHEEETIIPQTSENCPPMIPMAPPTESSSSALSCVDAQNLKELLTLLPNNGAIEQENLEAIKFSNDCPWGWIKVRSKMGNELHASHFSLFKRRHQLLDCANSPHINEAPEGTVACIVASDLRNVLAEPRANDAGEFLMKADELHAPHEYLQCPEDFIRIKTASALLTD